MYLKANKKWSKEDEEYLEDKWGVLPLKSLSSKLKRSQVAILRKAENMKLGGSMYDSFYTTVDVADIFDVDYTTIIGWIKKGWLKSTLTTRRQRKMYLIELDNIISFMINNPNRWTAREKHKDILGDEKWLRDKIKEDIKSPKHQTQWTVKQEQFLLQLVSEGKTNKEIASIMGRTYASVKRKRNKLYQGVEQ